MTSGFFDGFVEQRVEGADGVLLRVRSGGEGPPVVLLHGHPRTHTTWHRVAPLLAEAGHTVVPRPARLRPLLEAADDARPRSVLQAGDGWRRGGAHGRARALPLRRRRPRPRQLRRDADGDGPPRLRDAPRRARQRPARRGTRPYRRPFRRGLVALVLLRPTRQARTGHHRRSRGLVRSARARQAGGDGTGEPRRLPPRDPRPRPPPGHA